MINKRFMFAFLLLAMLSLMSGCAVNRATASLTPDADLNKVKSVYVVKLPADSHNIDELIKTNLIKRGYAATTGPELKPPYPADAVLTYVDKWMWDITMYMLELTILLRDPNSNFPMASGNSYHTSFSRKSPEAMIDEVLTNIVEAPKQ
jgi:hypothetical protein